MKIGELAAAAHCGIETIRYYEKEGLLPEPRRTSSNYRSYGPEHVERLRFVRNCRALDMAQDEIRALLGMMERPERKCGSVNRLIDEHIDHVDVRIAELLDLKRQLAALREQCMVERSVEDCAILQGLATMTAEAKATRPTHLG